MTESTFLIPWRRERHGITPFDALHRQIDRVFADLWRGFDLAPFGEGLRYDGLAPNLDVSETDKEIQISAELPGLDEKDIEVELTDDRLTIRGEKKFERDEKDKSYRLRERSYGAFQRSISLPSGIDAGKTKAAFEKGVLSVTLPKTAAARKTRKVAIKSK